MKRVALISASGLLFLLAGCSNEPQWTDLVKDGLNGWSQLNGSAPFEISDGVVTGTAVLNSPNSFICTKENYGDFILEFDTWFDPQMNSGVQIRSESRPDYQNGRVHGYQVELDPSERAWSGGIYDEARRGWLYTLDKNTEGKKALKVGEWNHYRVEAIGNSIRTWVNGIPCADLVDALTPSGFIALQVHSVGNDSSRVGIQVKWKNIRILTEELQKYATPYEPVIPQYSFLDNTLTEREKAEGWKLLFDGNTNSGWINATQKSFPENGWIISEGAMTTDPGNNNYFGGDIVTVEKFRNFELITDFMYQPGGNSGIKYFVDTERDSGSYSSIGCEYQIIDDRKNPDASAGIEGNRSISALYDLIAPVSKRDNGPGSWNRAVIIVEGNNVQHWMNGQLAVEYERGNDEWRKMVAGSKYRDIPGFGETAEGRILLQHHGDTVSFKNIKIRVIN